MKFGDLDAAQRYLKKYYDLGGTAKSRIASIKYMHPLSSIPLYKRYAFRKSLSKTQEETYQRALDWYTETYRKKR